MSGRTKVLLIFISLSALLVIVIIHYLTLPASKEARAHTEFKIRRGETLSQVADSLMRKGLIEDKKLFVFWATSLGYEKKIKAGVFEIPLGLNYAQLAKYLALSKPQAIRVTLIEGWPNRKIISLLAKKLDLDSLTLDSLCSNAEFVRSLQVHNGNLRGYLLPDTYTFPYGINERQVLTFLVKRTLAIFKSDSARRALHLAGMSIHQVLTLASIVQGEAILEGERPLIASVYLNRLRKRMRLQADPTIQFLLKGKPRHLLYRDLKIKSPYNTYLHYGLPPGPINNPGKASVLAVLYPKASGYLYFVAKGDGSHVFCRTVSEHSRAKAAFNRLRHRLREQARRKK